MTETLIYVHMIVRNSQVNTNAFPLSSHFGDSFIQGQAPICSNGERPILEMDLQDGGSHVDLTSLLNSVYVFSCTIICY